MTWTDNPYEYSALPLATVLQSMEDNFLELKASFASASSPSNPATGQIWVETDTNILYVYYGSAWKPILNLSTMVLSTANMVAATNIVAGAITEAKIGSGAVTNSKIGTGAVTEAKIGSGAVTRDKIANGEVIAGKIAEGNVIANHIAENCLTTVKMSTSLISQVINVESGNDYYALTFVNGLLTATTFYEDQTPA